MPGLNQTLANPAVLRQIRPDLLLEWLRPMRGYFTARGWAWPETGGADGNRPQPIDYDTLARLLREPAPDFPPELAQALCLVPEMATAAGLDALLQGARDNGLELGLGDEPTPADAALRAWVLDRRLLENLHNCLELTRPRAFRYFTTDADPVPPFGGPTAEQLAQLETRLNHFYEAWKRGPGARVFSYQHSGEWWFLVRHGAPCRREGALDQGRPTTVFYRPQAHDVLVYDPARGEMRAHCCTRREREVLLRAFGLHLFGRRDFFPGLAKYTLAPLVRRGRDCLACADVPGLERVRLTEVEFFFRHQPWKRIIQQADDIFELVDRAELAWPERVEDIARATFEVKFRHARRPRRLTIVPCNKALYGRDEDSNLLETWLLAREFIDLRNNN